MLLPLLLVVAGAVGGQDTGGPYTGTIAVHTGADTQGSCTDNRGQLIQEGRLFEPGPDECQVCTCLRSLPVLCRTVLCAPPQGCRSLRVGDACCEWVCDKWEDEAGAGAVSDLGLRLMASAITAIFSLSLLFFLIYRLRQRRLRGRQNHLEAEGYGPDADLAEEAAACPGPGLQLDTMKPGDRVMLRRPFPPSYSEAMYGVQQADNLDVSSELAAPPYASIHQDPVISYPLASLASLGRLVLPAPAPAPATAATLPASVRRVLGCRRRPPDLEERPRDATSPPALSQQPPSPPRPASAAASPCQNRMSPASCSDQEPELTQTTV